MKMSTATMPSPSRENSSSNGLLQRLAVERLKYNVNELQTLVDYDRRMHPLPPPKPATVQLIADHTAFTTSIGEIKGFVSDGAVKITVPFSILDSIDQLKRGSEPENVNARETVRWFDKLFRHGGGEQKGVRMQGKEEIYGTWSECLEWYNPPPSSAEMQPLENGFASPLAMTESMMLQATDMMEQTSVSSPPPPPQSLGSVTDGIKRASTAPMSNRPPSPTSPLPRPEVPRRIQPIVNCALFGIHNADTSELSKVCDGVTYLVTNNPETSYWAKRFSIPVLNTKELAHKVRDEARAYKEKKREYDIQQQNRNSTGLEGENRRNRSGSEGGHKVRHGHSFSEGGVVGGGSGGNGRRGGSKLDESNTTTTTTGGGSGNNHGSGRRRNRNNQNANANVNVNTNFSTSPRNNTSFGGGRGGIAQRGVSGGGYGRSNTVPSEMLFEKSNSFPLSPNSSGFRTRDEPEYVLGHNANRGVARGRGKLWIP